MSEKTRAFRALGGDVFPRVGDRGIYSPGIQRIDAEFSDDSERTVEVERVSATGATIWTRFVQPAGHQRYAVGHMPHRWSRGPSGIYWGNGTRAPLGELRFQ